MSGEIQPQCLKSSPFIELLEKHNEALVSAAKLVVTLRAMQHLETSIEEKTRLNDIIMNTSQVLADAILLKNEIDKIPTLLKEKENDKPITSTN